VQIKPYYTILTGVSSAKRGPTHAYFTSVGNEESLYFFHLQTPSNVCNQKVKKALGVISALRK